MRFTPEYLPLVLAVLGVADTVLGFLIFLFGPGIVDEPSLNTFVRGTGVVFVVGGAIFLWLAHRRRSRRGAAPDGGPAELPG